MAGRRLMSPMCVPLSWGKKAGIGTRLHVVIDGAWKTIKAIFMIKSESWKIVSNEKSTSRETWK